MLGGEVVVLQAPMLDGLPLDPFALFDDGIGPAEVGVGRGDVVEALVVAPMIVVLDEGLDLTLEVAGQEVILQENAVLQRLVPAFDLALVWGWSGAPRTWLMPCASIHSDSSPAM